MLQKGDEITAVDGKPVDPHDVVAAITDLDAGHAGRVTTSGQRVAKTVTVR